MGTGEERPQSSCLQGSSKTTSGSICHSKLHRTWTSRIIQYHFDRSRWTNRRLWLKEYVYLPFSTLSLANVAGLQFLCLTALVSFSLVKLGSLQRSLLCRISLDSPRVRLVPRQMGWSCVTSPSLLCATPPINGIKKKTVARFLTQDLTFVLFTYW